MKHTIYWAFVVTALIAAFTQCAREASVTPARVTRELNFTSEKPAAVISQTSRTVHENGSVLWSTSGERIRVGYTLDGVFTILRIYASTNAVVSDDRKTATFTVPGDFEKPSTGECRFYALYPSSMVSSTVIVSAAPHLSVNIPAVQSPAADSFDAAGDLLLAVSTRTYPTFPESADAIPLEYKRQVAHGCVTFTGLSKNPNFEAGETVREIVFSAPEGTAVTGSVGIDLINRSYTAASPANSTVTLNYTDAALTDDNFKAWFCSIPFEVAGGESFGVSVETDRGIYSRTLTARAGGIRFLQNHLNTLAVDMSSATFEEASYYKYSGEALGTTNTYKAYTGTADYNGITVEWTATWGSNQGTNPKQLYLGTNTNNAAKATLAGYPELAAAVGETETTTNIAALISNTSMPSIGKVVFSCNACQAKVTVYLVAITGEGTDAVYTLLGEETASAGTDIPFTFTPIDNARYALVIKKTSGYVQVQVPTLKFYQ